MFFQFSKLYDFRCCIQREGINCRRYRTNYSVVRRLSGETTKAKIQDDVSVLASHA